MKGVRVGHLLALPHIDAHSDPSRLALQGRIQWGQAGGLTGLGWGALLSGRLGSNRVMEVSPTPRRLHAAAPWPSAPEPPSEGSKATLRESAFMWLRPSLVWVLTMESAAAAMWIGSQSKSHAPGGMCASPAASTIEEMRCCRARQHTG